jgi:hypothetical protein
MKQTLLLFIGLSFAMITKAQTGSVDIIGAEILDSRIESKLAQVDTSALHGYRIQLFFGTEMTSAQQVLQKFNSLYPAYSSQSYMPYNQPYWKVRIGNFYSQLEAQVMLRKLEKDFDSVFLVKEIIVRPPL